LFKGLDKTFNALSRPGRPFHAHRDQIIQAANTYTLCKKLSITPNEVRSMSWGDRAMLLNMINAENKVTRENEDVNV